MCWSAGASLGMVALGSAAVAVTVLRREPAAIWFTIGYFTVMEALQAAGYAVVDRCGDPANRAITLASYLHIAVQPLVINAFAMALAPAPVGTATRRRVHAIAALCTLTMLFRLVPADWAGVCQPGDILCGPETCLVSGAWHIGWALPLNGLWSPLRPLGIDFPDYLLATFVLPLAYGAWRFVLFNLTAGLWLSLQLTSDPNEFPAVWCLFSVGIVLIGISPLVRRHLTGAGSGAVA